MTAWIEEIVDAFKSLDGAARYGDLYEYIERTTERDLTTHWKATVRRTIEDHSSDSANFRADDLFQHLDHGFWGLRDSANRNSLIRDRQKRQPKAVVDMVLERKRQQERSDAKVVFVREHWRRWPSKRRGDPIQVLLEEAVFKVVDGWVTDAYLEFKLVSGLIVRVPIDWYSELSSLRRKDLSKVEIGEYGAYWPDIDFQVLLPDILLADHVSQSAHKGLSL